MSGRKIVLAMTIAIICLGLTWLVSCKKKEQPAPPPKAPTMEEMHKHAEKMKKTATATAEEAKKTVETMAASVEQTVCPVTGQKIDKNVFVEYKGKKVYFCCADCKAKFEAEPEKYIAKLAIPILRGRIDSAKWAEGKSMMGSIATGIRAWCAEKGVNYNTAPGGLTGLGFAAGDLSGTYFVDADFTFTLTLPVTVPPVFSVTCTPTVRTNRPTNPASYTLNGLADGTTTWTP